MSRRVLILSASVGSGHNMAAQALETAFASRAETEAVQRIDVLETTNDLYRTFYDDTYFHLVDAAPWLVGWGYDLSDPPFRLGSSASLWDRLNTTETVRTIKAFRPDLVVCTHFLPTRLISLMISRGSLSCSLSAVTTDYDFAGLWLSSPFHHYFVARSETAAFMRAIGVPGDRVSVSGIPVRPGLAGPVDREAVLTEHGLRPDRRTLLLSAGAAGGAYTESIVRQLVRLPGDFQVVVVCGKNAGLKRAVELIVGTHTDRFAVLGYTDRMVDLVRAASLFIGKPGGLSSSECMAAGLPMVLIKPIPGQEDRNSDYLLEEGAAVRCNYDSTVGHKIQDLLERPGRLQQMAANARRIGFPDAAQQIAGATLADSRGPVRISRAARTSILQAYERGIATGDLGGAMETRTLVDPPSGTSLAVLTADQASRLSRFRLDRFDADRRIRITAQQWSNLEHQRAEADIAVTLRPSAAANGVLEADIR